MKQRLNILLKLFLMSGAFIVATAQCADKDKVFYRYKDAQGVKVVAQTIPPQFVRNGYELVSVSGEVIKVVPPSPSDADADRIAQERKAAKEQAKADVQLHRSYSTAAEIDAAKARNLQDLRNTINILKANLVSVKSQLKDQEALAASTERNGQKVSDDVLKNISTLRSEDKDLTNQISQREVEFTKASDKYDQDKKRFIEISTPTSKAN